MKNDTNNARESTNNVKDNTKNVKEYEIKFSRYALACNHMNRNFVRVK